MYPVRVGVIGGSGLYKIEGLEDVEEKRVMTPFGDPSDEIIIGRLHGERICFLPRHGRGHRISPTDVNSLANIYALKSLGVERIISVSAVGSLREEIRPLDIVLPDQMFDRTSKRRSTFFGNGVVCHVSFSDPFCSELRAVLRKVGEDLGFRIHPKGTYVCIEGPQFSTRAESHFYRSIGMDVIGMTNLPEAKLAREAEICYATLALVTDYDVWHEGEEDVTVDVVVKALMENVEKAKRIIRGAICLISKERSCKCSTALKDALITKKRFIPDERLEELKLLVGKYL